MIKIFPFSSLRYIFASRTLRELIVGIMALVMGSQLAVANVRTADEFVAEWNERGIDRAILSIQELSPELVDYLLDSENYKQIREQLLAKSHDQASIVHGAARNYLRENWKNSGIGKFFQNRTLYFLKVTISFLSFLIM